MGNKTREFLRAIRNNDENKSKQTLKEILKEKVLNRLRQVAEE